MGINKYNSEGYYDPTVYEALSNIEKEEKAARRVYRPLVYICSPYAGDVERNVNMARVYSRFAVRNTCIPITPHLLYPQFMDDGSPAERELASSHIRHSAPTDKSPFPLPANPSFHACKLTGIASIVLGPLFTTTL